jgi:hypothetical protein
VIRGYSRKGLTDAGWLGLASAAVLLIVIVLLQEWFI